MDYRNICGLNQANGSFQIEGIRRSEENRIMPWPRLKRYISNKIKSNFEIIMFSERFLKKKKFTLKVNKAEAFKMWAQIAKITTIISLLILLSVRK